MAGFMKVFAHDWDQEPRQPPERCIDHLLSMMLRAVDLAVGKRKGNGALTHMVVSDNKAKRFMQMASRMVDTTDELKKGKPDGLS